MIWEIELLYLVAMLATFVVLLLVAKTPSGIALMASALVGLVLSAIFSDTELSLRQLLEGGFGYFDTILVIVAAMIFIKGLEMSGALDYISVSLVKIFRKFPTVLILAFMLILMLPGMITGSSLASVISAGAIVAPIMKKMGLPKTKVAAIIAFGAILGMIAPPINIPVMVICDVVDIPYQGFTEPLLVLTLPLAIFCAIFLSRTFKKGEGVENQNKLEMAIILGALGLVVIVLGIITLANYSNLLLAITIIALVLLIGVAVILIFGKAYCSEINIEELKEDKDIKFEVLEELNITVLIPVLVLVLLFLGQSLFPMVFGMLGTPLLFIIAFAFTTFLGRKHNSITVFKEGVKASTSAMGLLIGVGMFVQVMTLSGARALFVFNVITIPSPWQYVAIALALPIFGGISAFGSASILGGPFVMSLLAYNEIIVASALSFFAALGEFLPPTAMSATFAGQKVADEGEEVKALSVTKAAIVPLIVCLVYALVFIIVLANKNIWG